MNIANLKTDRLLLKKISPEVMDFVFTSYSDEELLAFFGLNDSNALTKEKTKWEKGLTTHNRSFLYFLLVDALTQQTIGWCGYHTWYTDHDRAELGYGLYLDELKQKGLMSEALEAIIDFGFTEMNLHRIEALTATYNLASIRTLKKFNFQKEGVLKEHYLWEGKYEDSVIYGLIRGSK
jgi:ribosomal-protein-alanine N-acetyltransferase